MESGEAGGNVSPAGEGVQVTGRCPCNRNSFPRRRCANYAGAGKNRISQVLGTRSGHRACEMQEASREQGRIRGQDIADLLHSVGKLSRGGQEGAPARRRVWAAPVGGKGIEHRR
jgi:hypothetical protein